MNLLPLILYQVAPAILAITLHEMAHGYAAWALGDDTARRAGRLSPNPLAHVDPVGTLIVPGVLILGQLAVLGTVIAPFGWAKPVPVDAARFRDPRRGMMLVAAAGPAVNLALAVATALTLSWLPPVSPRFDARLGGFAGGFMLCNVMLAVFNLLPIPPLDGGRIAVGLLPLGLARVWARIEPFGIAVVALLLIGPALLGRSGVQFDPLRGYLNHVGIPVLLWLERLAASPLPVIDDDGTDV